MVLEDYLEDYQKEIVIVEATEWMDCKETHRYRLILFSILKSRHTLILTAKIFDKVVLT